MPSPRLVVIALIVLGILALAGGLMFVTVPAHSLPSFIPGHIAGSNAHHDKRGIAGIVLGVALLVVGVVYGMGGRTSQA